MRTLPEPAIVLGISFWGFGYKSDLLEVAVNEVSDSRPRFIDDGPNYGNDRSSSYTSEFSSSLTRNILVL